MNAVVETHELVGRGARDGGRLFREWFDGLPPDDEPPARRLLGAIQSLPFDSQEDRRELYKHGMLLQDQIHLINYLLYSLQI